MGGRAVKTAVITLLFTIQVLPVLAGLEGTKPNVILVITDDQGYGPIGAHGHPWLNTPNLDRFHGESVRFTRFFVAPTCAPTRSSIMTGRYPEKNGVTHTILERERLAPGAITLPEILKKAGYRSGIFGKWHLGDEDAYQPDRRGFDEVFIHGGGGIGQSYECSCADAPDNRYVDPVVRHNGRFVKTEGFCTDVFFDAALGWINEQRKGKEPFFAYIATNAPHSPFVAPEKDAEFFRRLGFGKDQAGFFGMIRNIDENMGRLMTKMAEWGLDENTVLIFMSDNGMAGGGSGRSGRELAPGHPFFNAGMKGLKGTTDEGGSRVPFFVRWKGKVRSGRDVDRIGAHIDILPTLASLAGTSAPAGQVEGRSLLPLIEGTAEVWEDRYIFNHLGRWPTGAEPDDFKEVNFSVRSQRFRYVAPVLRADGTEAAPAALYDMEGDPEQTKNVIADHPDVAVRMKSAFADYWKESRPLMVNESAPMSPMRPFQEAYKKQLAGEGIPRWTAPEF